MTQSKIYILPDSEEIDLSKIEFVSELKSVRSNDFSSLGYCYFTVFFKDGTSTDIQEGYFYSDLGKTKIKLHKIRHEILKSLL